jgi:hypothetical protein
LIIRLNTGTLAVVLALVVFAPSAHACVKLPAKSATRVPIGTSSARKTTRTAVKVCGRTLATAVLTRSGKNKQGARIGEASAAGNREAWIEERHGGGTRTAIITLADADSGRKSDCPSTPG